MNPVSKEQRASVNDAIERLNKRFHMAMEHPLDANSAQDKVNIQRGQSITLPGETEEYTMEMVSQIFGVHAPDIETAISDFIRTLDSTAGGSNMIVRWREKPVWKIDQYPNGTVKEAHIRCRADILKLASPS